MKKLLSLSISFLAVVFFIDIVGSDLNTLERAGRVMLLLLYITCALLFLQIDFDTDEFRQELTLTTGCMGGMLLVFGIQFLPLLVNLFLWFTFTATLYGYVRDHHTREPLPDRSPSPRPRQKVDIRA